MTARLGMLGFGLAGLAAAGAVCAAAASPAGRGLELSDDTSGFTEPRPVTITGYSGDVMEPFLTRDGKSLLFNDSNAPGRNTNLHLARRVDGLTFAYRGPLPGANSSALDAVASVDRNGRMVFVSARSYQSTLATLYEGRFTGSRLKSVKLLAGLSRQTPGWVNFDAEISADGKSLYFVDGLLGAQPPPEQADLVVARQRRGSFVRLPGSDYLLAAVNSEALEYAPCTSVDQLELFFTRLELGGEPKIFRATRPSRSAPFDPPELVAAAAGFVEAPTLSADGTELYFHRLDGGSFKLYRLTRPRPGRSPD